MKIKKLLFIILALTMLTGCNYQLVDYDYKYTKVHIYETNKCYEIKTWMDYEDGEQLQIDITDKGKILISSYSCFLVKEKCPICD